METVSLCSHLISSDTKNITTRRKLAAWHNLWFASPLEGINCINSSKKWQLRRKPKWILKGPRVDRILEPIILNHTPVSTTSGQLQGLKTRTVKLICSKVVEEVTNKNWNLCWKRAKLITSESALCKNIRRRGWLITSVTLWVLSTTLLKVKWT
jgi:hypothetical protein